MLEGTLREFSLADVFGFLALTKKSGVLRVSSDHGEGEVHFHDGEVACAVADSDRSQFGTRLITAGLVSAAELADALQRSGDASPAGMTQALVAAGVADETALHTFLRGDVEEAVITLLGRTTGTFHFEVGGEPDLPLAVALPTDHLIAQAGRRAGEWEQIRAAIPSLDAVVAIVPHPPQKGADVTVSSDAWHLLALADGHRTVADLMALTGGTEFATCSALARLVEAGLVEVRRDAGETALSRLLTDREQLRRLQVDDGHEDEPAEDEPAEENLAEEKPVVELLFDPEPQPMEDLDLPPLEPLGPEPVGPELVEEPAPHRPAPDNVDRVQVARELAALGLEEDDTEPARARPEAKPDTRPPKPAPNGLSRDQSITKDLLLRLIDGVKDA